MVSISRSPSCVTALVCCLLLDFLKTAAAFPVLNPSPQNLSPAYETPRNLNEVVSSHTQVQSMKPSPISGRDGLKSVTGVSSSSSMASAAISMTGAASMTNSASLRIDDSGPSKVTDTSSVSTLKVHRIMSEHDRYPRQKPLARTGRMEQGLEKLRKREEDEQREAKEEVDRRAGEEADRTAIEKRAREEGWDHKGEYDPHDPNVVKWNHKPNCGPDAPPIERVQCLGLDDNPYHDGTTADNTV
ncbi:hypothetical protein IMSHALPRED_003935 [Imshaugia aleurites]|uniref:Uncharacterized protein n=1 Tax=Imshaugia aleurites TaxID=172621 RepID=A0A8H3EI68_9LECA|nr:hypothetical protein IMSHALPRED_003935 [Imshaugia aleurites]